MAGERDDEALDAELVAVADGIPRRAADAGARDEPPVVARLVIEIRSDGSRTIARGAMEDRTSGQTVAIEARGDSPLGLALSLARSIATLPAMARTAARALLPGDRGRRRDR